MQKKMLTEFETKVADFTKVNGLFDSADRILLAVSGGTDSTALMYVMCALKAEGVLSADFVCAHINHQLRGADADLDEDFVVAQAAGLNLAITTRRLGVRGFAHKNKLSIETAARKLRVESLLDIAKANNCDRIATAHQKNDNAETVLQRLLRGTGFRGLGGIWPVRIFADGISFVRPLLCVRRDEIIEYLEKRNLKWRIDRTNDDCTHRRNYIRHRLLPELKRQSSGSVVEQLAELSEVCRALYRRVVAEADKAWQNVFVKGESEPDKVVLHPWCFAHQPELVQVELARRALTTIGSGERDLTEYHYGQIMQLAKGGTGRKIELPDGFLVVSEYEGVAFQRAKECVKIGSTCEKVVLKIPGIVQFGDYRIEAKILDAKDCNLNRFKKLKLFDSENYDSVEWFDFDKLIPPITARRRQEGDKFCPFGLVGEKKVGKYLTAQQIDRELRADVAIIADSEKIIWVAPLRPSELTKITSGTRKVLQLQITDANLAH